MADRKILGFPVPALLILILLLLICLSAPTQSQTLNESNFDTLKIYELALKSNGEHPRNIDPDALQLSKKLVAVQHTLIIIDHELLVVGHALGDYVKNKNLDKNREVRLYTEQEIIPTLFQNFEVFRELFAISLADTFSTDELNNLTSQRDLQSQKIDAAKSSASAAKFHNAAMVLGGALLAKVSTNPDNRLQQYGLK
jgi:hypothetical protein